MLKRIVFVGISLLITLSFAQAPDTLWTKTYGGTDHDGGYSLCETLDGGFIITGYSRSFTPGICLIKTDINGDTLWTRIFETPPLCRGGSSVQQTSDRGYIVVGENVRPFYLTDIYLIKTDSLGDTLWTRLIGGRNHDFSPCVVESSDSCYVFIWNTVSPNNIKLSKYDAEGNFQWMKGYDVGSGSSLQQIIDGGYIISGEHWGNLFLVKTDSLGDSLWTKVYGGGFKGGRSIQQTSDGGYIVTGDKDNDVFLMKTDSNGDSLWTKTYGGDSTDIGRSVCQTSDGGYIIAGFTNSFGAGSGDVYIIRTDNTGDAIWTTTYGGSDHDDGWEVLQTSDGKYIITGCTMSFGAGGYDVWLLKIGTDIGIDEEDADVKMSDHGATILSGPLLLPEEKNCKIFDITGRVVLPQHLKPGVYFVDVDGEIKQKVVKIR